MSMRTINFTLNGQEVSTEIEPHRNLVELLQRFDLRFRRGHNHFPANVVRHIVLAAKSHHRRRTGHAKLCFQRARPIINSRMDDPAVVSALMAGHGLFFFEDRYAQARIKAGKAHRG